MFISFEGRLFPKLPSKLIFSQTVLKKIQLACLACGIVAVKDRETCIDNEVMSSKQYCVFELYFCEFDSPIKLANCKVYTRYSPMHRDILVSSKC